MMKRSARLAAAIALRQHRQLPRRATRCCVWPCDDVDYVRTMSSTSSNSQGNGIPKGVNTSNPFEIQFHVEDIPADAAEEIAGIESCFLEDEIEKFHSEMIGVFGSEPEGHDGDGDNHPAAHTCASSSQRWDTSVPAHTVVAPKASSSSSRPVVDARHPQPAPQPPSSRRTIPNAPAPSGNPSIMLIQGPCTYVHDGWIGSKDRWSASEVEAMVDSIAQTHGLHVAPRHSNHEGQILDWLLTTAPGDKIILNWNGRLADSPIVFRALSSIRAFVVVLAPLDVELGPLPPSVKGVITGFGTRSLELAIQACK